MTNEPSTAAADTPNGQAATARSYRAYAASERAAADQETLPNRKAMHMRSADVWDERAEALEQMLSKREINEAAKAPYPPKRSRELRGK